MFCFFFKYIKKYFEIDWEVFNGNLDERDYFQKKLFKFVENFFSNLVKVYQTENPFKPSKKCGNLEIPFYIRYFGIKKYDFYVFVTNTRSSNFEYKAWASTCFVHKSYNNRPVMAQINLNIIHFPIRSNMDFHENAMTVIHETIHALGFAQPLYKYYVRENGLPYMENEIFKCYF